MSQMTDFLENLIVDVLFRGQSATVGNSLLTWAGAPTYYLALFTSAPSDSGGGTEVAGGGYVRVAVPCTMQMWCGTQGTGTTTASTGTSGQTSNNVALTFPAPIADWGTITHMAIFDRATGGNMLMYGELTSPVTVNNGDAAPEFLEASLALTFS
jgi:hypothetical protein